MKEYVHNILHENDHVKIDNFSAYTLLHKNVQKKMKKSKNILKNIKQNRYFLVVQSLNFQFFHAILNEDIFEKSTSSAFKHGIAYLSLGTIKEDKFTSSNEQKNILLS